MWTFLEDPAALSQQLVTHITIRITSLLTASATKQGMIKRKNQKPRISNQLNSPGITPNVKIKISCSVKPENKTLNTNLKTFFSVIEGKKRLKNINKSFGNTREITI